jgi:hypothetical protein
MKKTTPEKQLPKRRGPPPKPKAWKRSVGLPRISPLEHERMKTNAAAAEMMLVDYLVSRCCQPPAE